MEPKELKVWLFVELERRADEYTDMRLAIESAEVQKLIIEERVSLLHRLLELEGMNPDPIDLSSILEPEKPLDASTK